METMDLPKVLMLRPSPLYVHFESEFSRSFHFIKPYESSLPLSDFLASTPSAAASTAMLATSLAPPITADLLRLLPSLRCIVTSSVAFNYIDLAECRRGRISVASPGEDTAVVLLIDVLRKISAGDRYVRRGSWKTEGDFSLGSKVTLESYRDKYECVTANLKAFFSDQPLLTPVLNA